MTTPYWIGVTDIHDKPGAFLSSPALVGATGVLVSGDITMLGGKMQAEQVLSPLTAGGKQLVALPGNMDKMVVGQWLEEKGWSLHGCARELFPGIVAMGLGYSPPTPFATPGELPEDTLASILEHALKHACTLLEQSGMSDPAGPRLVLVSHAPPFGTACDRLNNGTPVGSHAVRAFIERHQPALCLCGHIHEARGQDRLGATHVLNPGPLDGGGYVLIQQNPETGLPQGSLHRFS